MDASQLLLEQCSCKNANSQFHLSIHQFNIIQHQMLLGLPAYSKISKLHQVGHCLLLGCRLTIAAALRSRRASSQKSLSPGGRNVWQNLSQRKRTQKDEEKDFGVKSHQDVFRWVFLKLNPNRLGSMQYVQIMHLFSIADMLQDSRKKPWKSRNVLRSLAHWELPHATESPCRFGALHSGGSR